MKIIKNAYASECGECTRTIDEGTMVAWSPDSRKIYHLECAPEEPEAEDAAGKSGTFSSKTDGYRKK